MSYYFWLGAEAEDVATKHEAAIKYLEDLVAAGLVRLVDGLPGDD